MAFVAPLGWSGLIYAFSMEASCLRCGWEIPAYQKPCIEDTRLEYNFGFLYYSFMMGGRIGEWESVIVWDRDFRWGMCKWKAWHQYSIDINHEGNELMTAMISLYTKVQV